MSDAIQRRLLDVREEGVEVRLFEASSVLGRGFVDSTLHATDRITTDAQMMADSDRWYRHDWSQIARERDGVTLRTAGLPPWFSTLAAIAPRPTPRTGHEAWARSTREIHCATAPMFGVVAVRDRFDRHATLRAGAVWQRLHLRGTELGLAMQPLNQIVELADRDRELGRTSDAERRLRSLAGDSGLEATFAFRCGYAAGAAKASARRPVEHVLIQRPFVGFCRSAHATTGAA